MTLEELIINLSKIDDITFGKYQLEIDLLHNKIKQEDRESLVIGALNCGKMVANELKETYQTNDIKEIALANNLQIITRKGYKDPAGRLIFALFTPPRKVQIMEEPLERCRVHTKEFKEIDNTIFIKDNLARLITAHELFHFFEEERKKTIYTKQTKITLWKVFNFKYKSTIRNLSEIAAMAFAKEMTSFPYSPYLVDFVLLWDYSKKNTLRNYNEIVEFYNETHEDKLPLANLDSVLEG